MRDRGGPVVVVSPHLDDAALSAWLVLVRGSQVRVVTAFAGEPGVGASGGWDAVTSPGAGRSAVATRRAEDLRALAQTRSEPVHLDLLDAQYRDPEDDESVHEQLTALLMPHVSGAGEVWLPAALGGHVDHLLTRRAALVASAACTRRFLYADLPYAGQPAWPREVTGGIRDALVEGASGVLRRPPPSACWSSTLAAVPDVAIEAAVVQRLSGSQRRAKLRTLDAYRTQMKALRCGRRNVLRRRRVFAYEVFWSVPLIGPTGVA